ncbi:MAG: HutD/Ves family protein [Marinomonas colpomeniae]
MLKANKNSSISIIKQSDYKRMPWKNGLGETLEIHLAEDADGVRFRISQAAVVADGVFSDFNTMYRTLVLLSGNGMTLRHAPSKDIQQDSIIKNILTNILDIAQFPGGVETHATLKKGSIEDLNIIVREADTKADVISCFAPHTIETTTHEEILFEGFYANQDCIFSIEENATETDSVTLNAQDFIQFKANSIMTLLSGSGVFIQVLSLSK